MNKARIRQAVTCLAPLAAAGLAGCAAQTKPLYYWGDYQPVVYSHFKGDSPEAQKARLEQTAHKAQSRGEALPPGFNAHLGLLYINMGQLDQARAAFQAEASLFPESRPYMEFLLSKFATQQVGDTR